MVPGKYNITIYRGSTWSIGVEAKDSTDSAIDFVTEGYDSYRMQIRPPFIKGLPVKPALLELTTANGRITLAESNTQIVLTISAADTAQLSFNEGKYDLELIKDATTDPVAAEVVDKLIYGSVTVIGEVTV